MLRTKYIISILLALCVCIRGFSQSGLRSLPVDPAVEKGVLPNGTAFYLVSNPWRKGVAEIAVLQRVCQTDTVLPVQVLASLSEDCPGQFERFLSRNGVLPYAGGWYSASEDMTLYRFRDVPMSRTNSADSLLMYVFRIMGRSAELSPEKYGTDNQTVIVSGDIDKAVLKSKMQMFSLSMPSSKVNLPAPEYSWNPDAAPLCVRNISMDGASSVVEFAFRTKAVPMKQRNTILPVVSSRMDDILSKLVRESVKCNLSLRNIESDVLVDSGRRQNGAGDGRFSIQVRVDSSMAPVCETLIAGTLAEMISKGFSPGQFRWASDMAEAEDFARIKAPLANSEYVDRCVAAALYGNGIINASQRFDIFATRALPDTTALRYFNRYARAVLSHIGSIDVARAHSCRIFDVNFGDTLVSAAPARKKIRFVKEKADPVTGGIRWTTSSGMDVTYRKMDTGGMTYWTLVLPGAESSDPGFSERDIASVNSVPSGSYFAMLAALGVHIRMHVEGGFLIVDCSSPSGRFVMSVRSLFDLLAVEGMAGTASYFKSGCFVVVSDMPYFQVQDGLKPYLGLAPSHDGAAGRPALPEYTRVLAGTDDPYPSELAHGVALTAPAIFSSSNYLLALVLEKAVSYALSSRLCDEGAFAVARCHFQNSQSEKLRMEIGFGPSDGSCHDWAGIGKAAGGILDDFGKNGLPADCVELACSMVRSDLDAAWQSPLQPLFAAKMRYIYAKDIYTGYRDKISSIDKAVVDKMLKSLLSGSRTYFDD